jgi:hypothetical protein
LPHNTAPIVVDSKKTSELIDHEVIHEISDGCPKCSKNELKKMNEVFETSIEIDVIERTYVKTIHKKQKYRCICVS